LQPPSPAFYIESEAIVDKFDGSAFETLGEWQFAHDKERTYIGTLCFSPTDGLELRVVDPTNADGIRGMFSNDPDPKPISASGRTHSHGHISLFNGFVSAKPMSSHGPSETVYFFNRGLLGLATHNGAEETFSSIFATSDLIRVWLDQKLVDVDMSDISNCVSVRHTLPKPIEIQIDDCVTLVLAWDRQGPSLSLAQSSLDIKSRPWIGVRFREAQRIDRCLTEIDSATRLISLLAGYEIVPSLTELRIPGDEAYPSRAYLLGSRIKGKDRSRDRIPMDLLFTYPAISERLEKLVGAWSKFQSAVPGCISTFFSANYSTYTNQRLFALTTVLEALHRHVTGNDCTLRKRITASLQQMGTLAHDVVGDPDAFAARVLACRNNEAHCNEEADQASGAALAALASKVRVIIDVLIMLEIGLTMSEVSAAMRRSREYWFYASNSSWPWDV
jgi:hypothetical protein